MSVFNLYDCASISLPSFNPATYQRMMGVPNPPDLEEILRLSAIPVKISCVVSDDNTAEIGLFLKQCQETGVRRLVLRKLYGESRSWEALLPEDAAMVKTREYCGNPVYSYQGMEVTLWDFAGTESTSINLFSNGWISEAYLLANAFPSLLNQHSQILNIPESQQLCV
jgi:hypothetical protein